MCAGPELSPLEFTQLHKRNENGPRKDIYDKWKVLLRRVWLEGGNPDGSVPSAAGSRYVHT